MAEVRAFRAFKYDLAKTGALGDLIAPPYDVISPKMQQELYDRNRYNVIRLDLNKVEPEDNDNNNRYTRAAGFLRDWLAQDIIIQDSARALYVYHQEFEVEGQTFNRKGFLTRVRLEKFGEGKIYPHEQTMSGPKEDRRRLFYATGMNLSPIFGLFPDEGNVIQNALEKAILNRPPLEATDHLGVVSRLWTVTDEQVVSEVCGLFSPKPIFIADGHHRYETSWNYLQEKREAGEVTDDEAPPNFTLMMLVGMSDPGLQILPTHRLVSGLPEVTSQQLQELLAPHFDLQTVGQGDQAAREAWEMIEMDGGQSIMGFGTVSDNTWISARFKNPDMMQELTPDQSDAWQELGVSILHKLVLEKLLAEKFSVRPQCKYVHLVGEVNEAMAAQQCQLAVLIPPASMQHVQDIASNLEKMPPKSTYFYPKLLTGLVFNSLKTS
ncbi:MAG: DUF1015 domain-containing protein [Gemmataceae bacterium]